MTDGRDTTARNVVLTGFMGTGKSTVGRLLAQRLGYDFVDTDQLIEERHGPIPTIFRERGEVAFRTIERDIATEIAARAATVVSTGGRLLLDADNAATLLSRGRAFCLTATVDDVVGRVLDRFGRSRRPLLDVPDPRARIAELLEERAEAYAAFEQVDTSGLTAHEVAEEIANRLTDEEH